MNPALRIWSVAWPRDLSFQTALILLLAMFWTRRYDQDAEERRLREFQEEIRRQRVWVENFEAGNHFIADEDSPDNEMEELVAAEVDEVLQEELHNEDPWPPLLQRRLLVAHVMKNSLVTFRLKRILGATFATAGFLVYCCVTFLLKCLSNVVQSLLSGQVQARVKEMFLLIRGVMVIWCLVTFYRSASDWEWLNETVALPFRWFHAKKLSRRAARNFARGKRKFARDRKSG